MKMVEVPAKEVWRPQYLMKLLMARKDLETKCSDDSEISKIIDSLCSKLILATSGCTLGDLDTPKMSLVLQHLNIY